MREREGENTITTVVDLEAALEQFKLIAEDLVEEEITCGNPVKPIVNGTCSDAPIPPVSIQKSIPA